MRDLFIDGISEKMATDDRIIFITADCGAMALDSLRDKYYDRFINIGIAEQNMINVAVGMALDGYAVYCYGLSTFIILRAYEQIRTQLSIMGATVPLNVTLMGVGVGLGYTTQGATHHCLEDLAIMRTLPGIRIYSPADGIATLRAFEHSFSVQTPKYIRLDARISDTVYPEEAKLDFYKGFQEVVYGAEICFVATGYMTHKAVKIARDGNCGVIDIFGMPVDDVSLALALRRYRKIVTLEEGFIGGGIGCLVRGLASNVETLGFCGHTLKVGSREYQHSLSGMDEERLRTYAR